METVCTAVGKGYRVCAICQGSPGQVLVFLCVVGRWQAPERGPRAQWGLLVIFMASEKVIREELKLKNTMISLSF